jgi:hypothetical protein
MKCMRFDFIFNENGWGFKLENEDKNKIKLESARGKF